MTMLNSSAFGGSPALPLIGPTPAITIPAAIDSGDVITFDWPADTASGTVTMLTDQGALVFQAPFPINQIGPLIGAGDYPVTWEGTYTNGQTFTQTGRTTVPEQAPETPPETVDYSLPENAEQIGVPQHELQYPILEEPLYQLPPDPNVAFEDLTFTQKVIYFAQRIHNEGNYVVEMEADMSVIANDVLNINTATRGRAAVNAVFIQRVGVLGAVETLRGYANWILGVIDGKSTAGGIIDGDPSNWDGYWANWLSVQEWYDTLVPANYKSSLVDPSS